MRHLPAIAIVVFAALWWLRPAPAAPIVAEAAPSAVADVRQAWAIDLLARLGNAQPSAEVIAFMVQWSIAEDAGGDAIARNNLYNTTLCLPGRMTGAINGDGACGVQGYATWQDGIEATALTIEQANFARIRAALLANDADAARLALWESPWAASHYGYGASWPQ